MCKKPRSTFSHGLSRSISNKRRFWWPWQLGGPWLCLRATSRFILHVKVHCLLFLQRCIIRASKSNYEAIPAFASPGLTLYACFVLKGPGGVGSGGSKALTLSCLTFKKNVDFGLENRSSSKICRETASIDRKNN